MCCTIWCDTCSDTAAEIVASQVMNQGHDYVVLSCRLTRPSVEIIVKLAGPHAALDADFNRTAVLHKLIADQTNVPIAEVLAVDTTYAAFPYRYLVQKRVQGQRWADVCPQLNDAEKRSAYRQLGSAVAELHNIIFSTFGEISFADSTSPQTYIDALLLRAEKMIPSARLRDLFRQLIEDRRSLFSPIIQASLCHDDLHHYNVLFDNGSGHWLLTGIIDFDKAYAGCGESDLARLDLWDNMMGDGFREAYRELRPIDAGYEQRRPIYQLLWCLEYAELSSRHLDDTRRLCDTLGIEFPGFSV